ncbi:MAG: shikimate kinase [Hyphomicrobiales bacterium]|nr:shikimate kinase [Hyphomicrobiales bacterium]
MHIVLVGMMGVGKSTIGKELSKSLDIPFLDIDDLIEKSESKTISKIFEQSGESYFRKREMEITLKALMQENKAIISTGGGAIMNKVIRNNILNRSISVWLKLDTSAIMSRIGKNNKRPLILQNTKVEIEKILEDRLIYYAMAQIHIECKGKNIKNCANEIIKEIELNE